MVSASIQAFPSGVAGPVNALAARWMSVIPDGEGTVFSPTGAWPVLAMLAGATAEGSLQRAELEEATGVRADEAVMLARQLIEWFNEAVTSSRGMDYLWNIHTFTQGVSAAIGLWVRQDVHPEPAYLERLAPDTLEHLSGDSSADAAVIQKWAQERTRGLVTNFSLELGQSTERLLVLASVLCMQVGWERTFNQDPGKNGKRPSPLYRKTRYADIIRTNDEITTVTVRGDEGFDVHLVIGREDQPASAVLQRGLHAIQGGVTPLKAKPKTPRGIKGPGVRLGMELRTGSNATLPFVHLATPPFSLTAEHELVQHARTFGLEHCLDDILPSSFPGLSRDPPVGVSQFKQLVRAEFGQTGFCAVAVTVADGMRVSAALIQLTHTVYHIYVTFDRPFGFIATHRQSGAALFSGWVASGFDKYDWSGHSKRRKGNQADGTGQNLFSRVFNKRKRWA